VDRIAYRIDMRERAMAIAPQPAITKDNVSVDVSGILYVQFVDPAQAAYGSFSACPGPFSCLLTVCATACVCEISV
jgi:regulator of protease activity HflC (stomatin/prohibitin superfamily)